MVTLLRNYVLIVSFTCVSFVYYCDMMWITLDRLMLITFTANYNCHWNERKAKFLLFITLMTGIGLCTIIFFVDIYKLFDWEVLFFTYFVPIFDFIFIVLAGVTYLFIFRKYAETKSKLPSRRKNPRMLQPHHPS